MLRRDREQPFQRDDSSIVIRPYGGYKNSTSFSLNCQVLKIYLGAHLSLFLGKSKLFHLSLPKFKIHKNGGEKKYKSPFSRTA